MPGLPKENLRPTDPQAWKKVPAFKVCKQLITSFSTTTRHRNPPNPNKTQHVRLITIGPSNFCEKARWALDILDNDPASPVYYTEDAHPPVFQSIGTLEASNGKASMVPMVIYNDAGKNKVIYNSQNIVEEFCPFLYPAQQKAEILKLEEYFGSHVGATIRCYLYHVMLKPEYHALLANLLTAQSSSIEKLIWGKLLDNGVSKGMKKVMGINLGSAEASLNTLRNVFDEVSERLKLKGGSKKKYIMDTETKEVGFTAADLAFCSLASAAINPPELSQFNPIEEDKIPPELLLLRDELRKTLAGQHVLEIYRERRNNVVPKVVNRDRLPWGGIVAVGVGIGACTAGITYTSKL